MISGVAAILVLAAAASAFVLAVAGPWPRQPVHFFVVILLWHVPWVAYGFLVRSLLVRLENRGTRAAVGLGSLLLLGILMLFCSWRWGVHDGEVQGFLAVAAAIPMVSILAGGLSDLIVRRDALAVHEPTCQHA
jgi:hypothetical protein